MKDRDTFKQRMDRLLRSRGHRFQGIRLRCHNCGEQAFAKTREIAEAFGWSDLMQQKGPLFVGRCIDCNSSPPPQPPTKRRKP